MSKAGFILYGAGFARDFRQDRYNDSRGYVKDIEYITFNALKRLNNEG